jgi:hypothetical protein
MRGRPWAQWFKSRVTHLTMVSKHQNNLGRSSIQRGKSSKKVELEVTITMDLPKLLSRTFSDLLASLLIHDMVLRWHEVIEEEL